MASLTQWPVGKCGCNCGSPLTQTFKVEGCNNAVISGATVYVYSSLGGSLLRSGTTNLSGIVSLTWTGNVGTYYYITASVPSGRLSFGQSTSIPGSGTLILNMAPVSGYSCITGFGQCPVPAPNTLLFTGSNGMGSGALTVALIAGNNQWAGNVSWNFSAQDGCSAIDTTINVTYNSPSGSGLSYAWTGSGGTPCCPQATVADCIIAAATGWTCPPSLVVDVGATGFIGAAVITE